MQADLARTFKRLIEAEQGASHLGREAALRAARDRFYQGDIAEEMIAFSDSEGGWITMEDLAEFSVKIEPPVSGKFREYTVYTCDAWCQGPVVAQTLQMLEDDDLAAMGHNSAEYIHLVSQALNLAYADRHAYYGDPDLVDVPMKGLLSKGYTTASRADIDMTNAFAEMPEPGNPWPYQGVSRNGAPAVAMAGASAGRMQDTSYVCAVDQWGNAFSATPSDPLAPSPIVPGLGIQMSSRGSQTWLDPEHPSMPRTLETTTAHTKSLDRFQRWKTLDAVRDARRRHPMHIDGAALPQHRRSRYEPAKSHRGAALRHLELPQLLLAAHLLARAFGPRRSDRCIGRRRVGRPWSRSASPRQLDAHRRRDDRDHG